MHKKQVMIWTDVGRGLIVLLATVLLSLQLLTPAWLIALTMGNSILEALRSPAGSALTPLLLPQEKYTLGSGLNGSASRAAELIGLALAGSTVAWLGVEGALLIDMGTFFLSALIIAGIRVKESFSALPSTARHVVKELIENLRYARKHPTLFCILGVGTLLNLAVVPLNTCSTPYVVDVLQGGPELLSVMQISLVVGMGLGSFLVPKMKRLQGRNLIILGGTLLGVATMLLYPLPQLAEGLSRTILVALFTFFIGTGVGIVNVVFSASMMRLIPQEKMGALSGVASAVLCACIPLGSFLCSGALQFVSIATLLLLSGIITLIVFWAMLLLRPLKEL